MVEGRLRKRMRALGQPDFASYCNLLFKQGGLDQELTHLINAVTTNKTDFFREAEHFDYLVEQMVPSLIKARERNPLLKIWSAASSTGAEAYTLAMVLGEMQAQRNDFRFAILGTDISTAVLAQGPPRRLPGRDDCPGAARSCRPATSCMPAAPVRAAKFASCPNCAAWSALPIST